MLQAPSPQLSRVCGHGHIKKFWLMQTQKETQTFDGKNNITVSSSSPTRHATMLSKAFDCSQWSPARISPFEDTAEKILSTTSKSSLSPRRHSMDMPISGDSEMDGHDGDLRLSSQHGDTSSSSSRSLSSASGSAFEKKPSSRAVFNTEAADQAESLQSDESVKSDVHVPSSMADSLPSTTCVVHFRRKHQHGEHAGLSRARAEAKSSSSPSSSQLEATCEDETDKSDGEKKPSKQLQSSGNDGRSYRDFDDASQNGQNGGSGDKSPKLDQESQNPVLKSCTLCGTTKTPMWRSGPQGPKSLCNACGIRFKKYRSFPGQGDSADTTLYSCSKFMSRPHKRKQNANSEASKSQEAATKSSVVNDVSRQQKKNKWQHHLGKKDGSRMRQDLYEHGEVQWSSDVKVKQESSEKLEGIVSWKYSGSGSSALLKNDADKDLAVPWKYSSNPAPLKKIYGYSPIQSKLKKMDSMDEHHSRNRFAKDEEEAAALLMQLSCGLVY